MNHSQVGNQCLSTELVMTSGCGDWSLDCDTTVPAEPQNETEIVSAFSRRRWMRSCSDAGRAAASFCRKTNGSGEDSNPDCKNGY